VRRSTTVVFVRRSTTRLRAAPACPTVPDRVGPFFEVPNFVRAKRNKAAAVPLTVAERTLGFLNRALTHAQMEAVAIIRKDKNINQHRAVENEMRRLGPPRSDGVIAVMLAAMFLVGMTLGSILSPHQSEPTQIASTQIASIE
jgi:hypothetical protein